MPQQGQRELRTAMPVEGTEYDKFFGTSVPHDSVVPKVPQDRSAKQASNYNEFFGASVSEERCYDVCTDSSFILMISDDLT
jgi:hypothetical protein